MLKMPPLGTMPYNIKAQNRIKDLAEAIVRYAYEPGRVATSNIECWAREIEMQCKLIKEMRDNDEYYPQSLS